MKPGYRPNSPPVATIGDSYFENLGIPYRRISIVPVAEMTEIVPPSTENDNWLDDNRPTLIFGYPKPEEYGLVFKIP